VTLAWPVFPAHIMCPMRPATRDIGFVLVRCTLPSVSPPHLSSCTLFYPSVPATAEEPGHSLITRQKSIQMTTELVYRPPHDDARVHFLSFGLVAVLHDQGMLCHPGWVGAHKIHCNVPAP